MCEVTVVMERGRATTEGPRGRCSASTYMHYGQMRGGGLRREEELRVTDLKVMQTSARRPPAQPRQEHRRPGPLAVPSHPSSLTAVRRPPLLPQLAADDRLGVSQPVRQCRQLLMSL